MYPTIPEWREILIILKINGISIKAYEASL